LLAHEVRVIVLSVYIIDFHKFRGNTSMNTSILSKMNTVAVALAVSSVSLPSFVFADAIVEEVVTTGSRVKARSVTETPAPVDVISASELANQGDTDISSLLRNTVPSYSVNDEPISDAATFIRPANLRGMAPDHTLLLVNGKRRHRASVITWVGNGISNASQGPDAAAIPAIALKSIEVLRDGASSIYGSDAIAGVINFQLKDASDGGMVELRGGQYSEGDGQSLTVAMNKGLLLGSEGFANISLEYGSSDPTSRSAQRDDAAALIANGIQGVQDPAMIWGRPIVDDNIKFFVNFGGNLGNDTEMYGYTNYNSKDIDGGFYYRNPHTRNGVYSQSNDSVTELLIYDSTGDESGNCSQYAVPSSDPSNGALQSALAGVAADNNCFHFSEMLPGGFTPRFGGKITDHTFLFGLKGETEQGLGWDVSTYYGTNKTNFYINNTVNASLGSNTPRDFDPGYYEQSDSSLNADFTYAVNDSLGLAFGAEYRVEEFTIGAGEEASWMTGPLAYDSADVATAFSTSSNGFPGFSPDIAGSFDRSNIAAYVEANWDATDDLLVQVALRSENFEDFGVTTNGKIGANYSVSENMGIRSTFSTGFKAPTPGQSNSANITTELDAGTGELTNKATLPVSNPVSILKGAQPLNPEESNNFTFGIYASVGAIDITLDYFDIDVENRLNLSSDMALTPDDINELRAMNYPGAGDMSQVRFFTNDFDTNTSGFDVVVSTTVGNTDFNLAYNNTKTEVTRSGNNVNEARIRQIEDTTPDTRWNLSGRHTINNLQLLSRVSYYGEWWDHEDTELFDGEYLVDVEASYQLSDDSSLLIGGNNIFNNAGGESSKTGDLGRLYSQYAPMGFNGAYWYATYRHSF
jgi:iron complex outermembrane receptor protein